MTKKILGIDPGGTTGFCSILIDPLGGHRILESFETKDIWLSKRAFSRFDKIVVESVVAHGKLTEGKIEQIKTVGYLEVVCDDLQWVTPEERSRVQGTALVKGTHAKDAYRVALAYALREGLITKDEAATLSDEGFTGEA